MVLMNSANEKMVHDVAQRPAAAVGFRGNRRPRDDAPGCWGMMSVLTNLLPEAWEFGHYVSTPGTSHSTRAHAGRRHRHVWIFQGGEILCFLDPLFAILGAGCDVAETGAGFR